ncbi:MAG TPA: LLM class flavin-dependent oxidoreductase [Candidatus Limnocylindrales bacterium]|nr:LLM class flavin-dependent oxidoreductase [Candidatus Limnocylindrales bacterium]
MAKQVEFGLRLPVAGPLSGVGPMRRVAQLGEELGYDCLWVHDFIAFTKFQDRTHVSCGSLEAVEAAGEDFPPLFMESLTNLAYVAAVTDRIRIGVAVLCLPYRNPIVAAKQVANVDVLSNGRLILGVGVGAAQSTHNVDFEVLGVSRADKYARTKDYLRAMIAIWTERKPSYSGRFISFPETEFDPKPVQKPYPPIWIGGGGPKSVEIVAEFATGWLPPWIAPEGYPGRIAELKTAAERYGRGDVDFDIGTEVYVSVAPTSEQARNQAVHTLGVLTEGFADDATPEAIEKAGLIGSPEQISEKLAKYVAGGVHHYEMKFIYQSVDHLAEQLELFRTGVMANFR